MKTNAKTIGVILFTAATVLFGCKKEEIRPMNAASATQPEKSPNNFDQGTWTITQFYMSKGPENSLYQNDASKFKGWAFTFYKDGTLLATKEGARVVGKWSLGAGNIKEGVYINFGRQVPFAELNNSWRIAKQTSTSKMLQDRDASDGLTGTLVFEQQAVAVDSDIEK